MLNGATNTIVAGPLGTGSIAGDVHVNPATGRVYAHGSFTRVWGPSPSFSFIGDLPGFIRGVNPVTNRLYFGSGPDLQVRDGNTHAILATIAGAEGSLGVDTGLNRLYVVASGVVKVINGVTNTVVSTFSLGPGISAQGFPAVDSVKHRIYVAGHVSGTTRLYVVEDAVAPVANAGPDQTVNEGALVTLDGSGSTGGTLTYLWTQVSGTSVSLSSTTAAQPTFTAPQVSVGGETLTFQLVVNNGQQNSQPDQVNIMVKNVNKVPVCEAGPAQMVHEGGAVTLDGSGSYDPDGEPLTYLWTQTGGTAVSLSSATAQKPTFTAPVVGPSGETLSFQLTVSDGTAGTSCGTTVQVINVNQKPVSNAGPDQTKNEGTLVALNGTGSMDPDGDALTYAWSQVSGPAVVLSDPSSATPNFTAPPVNPGGETLVFQLVVHDGQLPSDPDTVVITIQNVNDPPVCSLAQPNPASLWPPNHGLVPVSITNVADANNDQVVITVTGVTQDEPVNGLGDGDTSPDAVLQGSQALVRAERSGTGNGRVYEVHFTASDGQATGGSCAGTVKVQVPHSKKSTAVDDGQLYNSTLP